MITMYNAFGNEPVGFFIINNYHYYLLIVYVIFNMSEKENFKIL